MPGKRFLIPHVLGLILIVLLVALVFAQGSSAGS
jgi:hypothetical protein